MTSPGGYRERRGWGRAWAEPLSCACLPPVSLLHSRETYNSLAAWLTDARTLASPNIVVILCGNKKDLDPEREVTFLEASRFAQENGEGPVVGQWRGDGGCSAEEQGQSLQACRPPGHLRLCPARECGDLEVWVQIQVLPHVSCATTLVPFPHLTSGSHGLSVST